MYKVVYIFLFKYNSSINAPSSYLHKPHIFYVKDTYWFLFFQTINLPEVHFIPWWKVKQDLR